MNLLSTSQILEPSAVQRCVRCIMDTSDPEIRFDAQGICNHCWEYEEFGRPRVDRANSAEGKVFLEQTLAQIRKLGKGRQYDCIMGVSGGVDSSFVAYKAKEFGLRPLAVHFDSGWNSELAVNNIENIVKRLDIDLHTFVVDWDEMQDLQLAFFKACVANCDIPTDQGFLAVLHHTARQHGIRTILSGGNVATEYILPKAWGYTEADIRSIRAIHRKFGKVKLRNYPIMGFGARYFFYPFVFGLRVVRLLDLIPYNRQEAKSVIHEKLGWRDYGGKHWESVFTRFFQVYYLPKKFGYDKRKAHLSSLIVSGQMTRKQALQELAQEPFSEDKLREERDFVAKKLGVTPEEFENILRQPNKTFRDYPSNYRLFQAKDALNRFVKRWKRNG